MIQNAATGLTAVPMSSTLLKFWPMSKELLPVDVYNHALQICIGKLTETNLHRVLQAAFRHCACCSGAAVYQIIPLAQPSCNLT